MLFTFKKLARSACRVFRTRCRNQLCCRLDTPEPRGLCPGSFNVFSGWVFDKEGRRLTGVEVFQNGRLLGTCDYGLAREDVGKAIPHCPQARESGFSGCIPVQQPAPDPVYVYAVEASGQRHMIARRQLPLGACVRQFFKKQPAPEKPRPPHAIPRQILIAGMAKTGTTGLFYKIGNSLISCGGPALQTKLLFEPTGYSGPENQRVLAKIIISKKSTAAMWRGGEKPRWTDFEDFRTFGKKILLQRDPRDRLISSLLYSTQDADFQKNTRFLPSFLGLLKKKERDPGAVSVLELIEVRLRTGSHNLQSWKTCQEEELDCFLEVRKRQSDFFQYRYEDFVRGDTRDLAAFLGFPLCGDAAVEKSLNRVVRTKKSGDWQNWFTEEDILFFRPVFQDFMRDLGYEDLWNLPERQIILPEHGSEYVKKITGS